MRFALSQIAIAIGATVAASAAVAAPFNPVANYTSGVGVSDVFLAGSSAVDLALTKFIANACNANSLDVYRTDSGGKTYYLWTCEVSSGFANSRVAIHKNTNSSADGVNLIATQATTTAFLQVSDLSNLSGCTQTTVAASATIPAYNLFVCGTTVGGAGVGSLTTAPNIGFSDSEPTQYSTANAGALTAAYPFSIIQGIPVTVALRNALQATQGLVFNSEAAADVPNLTSAQINAIYTGRYSKWSDALGLSTTALGSDSIYKIRRSNGSGTSRAFFATFTAETCVPGAKGTATGTTLATSTIGSTQCVAAGAKSLQAGTSDDVAACLSSMNTGNLGGIGYLSTDYQPTAADGYRWVKIDGNLPSVKNVVDGKWKMWSELSMNYKTGDANFSGDVLNFYNNMIKAQSANAGLMGEVVSNLTQTTSGGFTGGIIGALANSKNVAGFGLTLAAVPAVPRSDAAVIASPANPLTRATLSGYNLCAPAFPVAGYIAE